MQRLLIDFIIFKAGRRIRRGRDPDGTMDLSGRILANFAIMLPPENFPNFHRTIGTGSRGIVFKERAQTLLNDLSILFAEPCLFRKLHIDGALDLIQAEAHKVLHSHAVGSLLPAIVFPLVHRISVDALGDLHRLDLNGRNAYRLVNRDRPAHADGKARPLLGLSVLPFFPLIGKQLPERSDVQPRLTCLFCFLIIIEAIQHLFRTFGKALAAIRAAVL